MNKSYAIKILSISTMIITFLLIGCGPEPEPNYREIFFTVNNELNSPIAEVRIERYIVRYFGTWGTRDDHIHHNTNIKTGESKRFYFFLSDIYYEYDSSYNINDASMVLENLVLVANNRRYTIALSRIEYELGSTIKSGEYGVSLTKNGEIKRIF